MGIDRHHRSAALIPKESGYLPSLDGWRAVCILAVLGEHSQNIGVPSHWIPWWTWLFDGNLGVRCFFVISGFLITTLLLREFKSRGSIDLKSFYLRRVIRIFPVYFAFLAFVAMLQAFTSFSEGTARWVHLLTFTVNFSTIDNWLTGHLWSLATEEQFYLIWPPLLLTLIARFKNRWLLVIGLLIMLVCPLWRVVGYLKIFEGNPLFGIFNLFNYLDTLAVGCGLAFVHPHIGRFFQSGRIRLLVVAAVLMVVVPYALVHSRLMGILTVPFAMPVQAVGMALVLSLSIHAPGKMCFRWLNLAPVAWLGRLSYSLYIWQQFFCTRSENFGWKEQWFQQFPIWVLPTFLTAIASYYLLEQPLIRLRKRLHETSSDRLRTSASISPARDKS